MSAATIKDPRDVVHAPVDSEKSYGLIDQGSSRGRVDLDLSMKRVCDHQRGGDK